MGKSVFRFVAFTAIVVATLMVSSPVRANSGLQLWTTAYRNTAACRSHSAPVGTETLSRSLQGHHYPHTPGMGIEFLDRTAKHLNAAVLGRANDRALADRLLSAARNEAFTRLDFQGPGGSSPAFVSAVVVESVAYSVSYLRSRNALTAGEVKEIDVWVRKLLRNAGQRANSQDHKAVLGSSQLMWGAATGNVSDFNAGRRKLTGVLGKLRSSPYFVNDLRNNNEVMHHMVHAGMVLRLNGIDVFNAKFGKYTFTDAIAYHAVQVAQNGSGKVTTKGDAAEQARSIFRAQGWGTHLAWIPVYLSAQPSGSAASQVRALDAALRRVDRKPYWGLQMAVHTGCLYGR